MRHGIQPLGRHVVYVATGAPVALVAVVGAEDDEEGYAGDEDANGVGVVEDVVLTGNVELDDDVDYGGDYAGDGRSPDGGAVDAEHETEAEEGFVVWYHCLYRLLFISFIVYCVLECLCLYCVYIFRSTRMIFVGSIILFLKVKVV